MKTTVPDKIKAHIIMTDTGEKTFFMRWLPVLTLTLCTFVFNTSEFIPIGLLTDIGRDYDAPRPRWVHRRPTPGSSRSCRCR